MRVKCPKCKNTAVLQSTNDAKLSFQCGSCSHEFSRALPKSAPKPVKEQHKPEPPKQEENVTSVSHNVHVKDGPFVNYRNTGPVTMEWMRANRSGPGWRI